MNIYILNGKTIEATSKAYETVYKVQGYKSVVELESQVKEMEAKIVMSGTLQEQVETLTEEKNNLESKIKGLQEQVETLTEENKKLKSIDTNKTPKKKENQEEK